MESLACLFAIAVAGVIVLLLGAAVMIGWGCMIALFCNVLDLITSRISFCNDHAKGTASVIVIVSIITATVLLLPVVDFVRGLV